MTRLANSWWKGQLLFFATLLTLVVAPVARPQASCGYPNGGACSVATSCENICSCFPFNQYVINCGDCWFSQQAMFEEAFVYVEGSEGCDFPVFCEYVAAADCLT